jgi:tetratricopeptide (TPR) repeat protein/O-antigen ligase
MASKITRFLDGIIEAAVIAGIIVVPLFFNVYSSRIFEPDKVALLRSLALIIVGSWLIKYLASISLPIDIRQQTKDIVHSLRSVPMLMPVLAFVLVYLIATSASITPRVSWWGSYQRLQGTYTTLSYVIFFFAILSVYRRHGQIHRLVDTMIITSVPICVYGILQRFGLDPVPWGGDVSSRIAANMGNSIFLGAYLVMVFPLTVSRVIQNFQQINKAQGGRVKWVITSAAYLVTGGLHLIAIYLSGSRGPLLGLLAGVFLIFLLLSLYWKQKKLLFGTLIAATGVGLFLFAINIPNGPLESIRTAPWLGRLGQVFDTEQRTSRVRNLIWNGAADLVSPHEPLEFPDGRVDQLNFVRPMIGYGPESMHVAYNRFYPPELGRLERRNAVPDRAHNETWDALVTTGVIGFAVYMWVFAALFYYSLKLLGILKYSKNTITFFFLYFGGGILSATVLIVWQGIGYLGVGLPFGMILGAIAYLTYHALASKKMIVTLESNQVLMLIAPLSAIVAHFVEIHFGIAIVSTRLYFWVMMGLIVVIGHRSPRAVDRETNILGVEAEPVNKESQKESRRIKRRANAARTPTYLKQMTRKMVGNSILLGIILSTLGFDYVSNLGRAATTSEVLWNSLTLLPAQATQTSYGVLLICLCTWIIGSVVLNSTKEGAVVVPDRAWLNNILVTLAGSGIIGLVFWFIQSYQIAVLTNFIPSSLSEVLTQVDQYGGLLLVYFIAIFLFVVLLGSNLVSVSEFRSQQTSFSTIIGIMIVAPVTLGLISLTNLRPMQADIFFKLAEPFIRQNQHQIVAQIYDRALELTPFEDHYHLFQGRGYMEYARLVQTDAEREHNLVLAEKHLLTAQALNPLNTDHTANLARLYSWWSANHSDLIISEQLAWRADQYYEMATRLSPNHVNLWGERAANRMRQLNDGETALTLIQAALMIDPEFDRTYAVFGDYYLFDATHQQDAILREASLRNALTQYQRALDLLPERVDSVQTRLLYLSFIATLHNELQESTSAIAAYQNALELAGPNEAWRIHEYLARLYYQQLDKQNALLHIDEALKLAPGTEQQRLQDFATQVQTIP